MPIIEELRKNPEPLPEWLRGTDLRFNRENFFASRTLYYPGSGTDGFPIRVCSIAHAVHTFVYVDFWHTAESIEEHVHNFEGNYKIECLEFVDKELVCPNGWHPRVNLAKGYKKIKLTKPYYLYAVLCRREDRSECHGPKRIAILFIGRDAFEAFDILYCQSNISPYLIVVQDHDVYYGNIFDRPEDYRFDNAGMLRRYAIDCNAQPELLLVGHNSTAWCGYQYTGATDVPRTEDCTGRNNRRLYRRRRRQIGL